MIAEGRVNIQSRITWDAGHDGIEIGLRQNLIGKSLNFSGSKSVGLGCNVSERPI